MKTLQVICYWISCLFSGRGCSELVGMIIPGNLFAALLFLLMLMVIVPCCFMPLFIDLRYKKDSCR